MLPGLRLHCYRLVGTLDDAEDMVQEALVRAWRTRGRLADTEGLRPWLYRIATNACLDLLARRRRRPATSLEAELGWPDPVPQAWLAGGSPGDPVDAVLRRESVGLAFLTAVSVLPPRQRAMLVLRDVLDWPAADIAEALETSVAAVYSGVQRARATIRERSADATDATHGDADSDLTGIADRYIDAWERADVAGLAGLLAADARMAMPPDPRLFRGRPAIVRYLASVLAEPPERRIGLARTSASGGPAFLVLEPDPVTGLPHAIGVKVLLVRAGEIVEIRGHMRASLAAWFQRIPPRADVCVKDGW
ncbi:MAG: hypothetical protein A2V85_15325 [Chloroflexi bacterium RBG_16_72_14]|nr:MAG: hypothetical protein A2V85_15325 [Chloroflexi bacterium RBG_16_72_14]